MKVIRRKITIYGLVQGVGFRPFVAEQAEDLDIAGTVRNLGGIVKILAEGKKEALDEFVHRLSTCAPEGARVDRVEVLEISQEKILEEQCFQKGTSKEDLDERKALGLKNSFDDLNSRNVLHHVKKKKKFFIIDSEPAKDVLRFLPPDIATCDFCKKELFDRKNRRYRYPFISCTACGPRFSILERVPYDRETVTMRDFPMCPSCAGEYGEKGNKRRHAQTIACAECGPQVRLYEHDVIFKKKNGQKSQVHSQISRKDGQEFQENKQFFHAEGGKMKYLHEKNVVKKRVEYLQGEAAVRKSIELLRQGKILAVKDIGGFHFAFDPMNRDAAKRLRAFKNRERKPFAVMFPEISDIERYCEISDTERSLLCSPARPIVLLKKRAGMDFAPEVCGESSFIGAMLPCNPLQMLLLCETGPLVMTSGNRGGEPIITDEEAMFAFWNVPDAVLTHDRRILYGLDDSIFQVTACGEREVVQLIRRARGLVPEPVALPGKLLSDTFAAGGDLKAVFALGRENMAYCSAHFGDLENVQAGGKRAEALKGMCELLGISPVQAVCDRHPGYISVRNLEEDLSHIEMFSGSNDVRNLTKVQHHHAHIAAVMAEYALQGKVLGVAYDGTGYGDDGTVWGGEFLICEGKNCTRAAHLESVLLTGGDAAAKNALVTAYCYLYAAQENGTLNKEEFEKCVSGIFDRPYISKEKKNIEVAERHVSDKKTEMKKSDFFGIDKEERRISAQQRMILDAALKNHINTCLSSSMGRLFDAAAAVLDICTENSYEGECPEKLQAYAMRYFEKEESGHLNRNLPKEDIFKIPIQRKNYIWTADGSFLIAALARERANGVSKEKLAYEFHRSIAQMTVRMCELICTGEDSPVSEKSGRQENTDACNQAGSVENGTVKEKKITKIALGGGCMYNRLLLKLLIPELEKKGYEVYINEKVPSGDGGLAYGQMALLCTMNL